MKKSTRIMLISLAVVLLAINVALLFVPSRYTELDVTRADNYSLTDNTESYLSSLDRDVTLYLIDNNGEDIRFEYFIERFSECGKRISLERIDISDAQDVLAEVGADATALAEIPYALVLKTDKRAEIIDYYSLFYYYNTNSALIEFLQSYFGFEGTYNLSVPQYQTYAYYLEQYSSMDANYQTYYYYLVDGSVLYFQGESVLSAAIEYVCADIIPQKYALTGHGEYAMAGSAVEGVFTLFGETCKTLDITSVDKIPEDAASVYVSAPTSDYSESEMAMLRTYLEGGGTVVLITNEANLGMKNLMSLMSYYGMSAKAGAVREWTDEINDDTETTTTVMSDAAELKINPDHDALAALAGQATLIPAVKGANAISFTDTADTSLICTPLLTTESDAFIGEDRKNTSTYTVAAAAENNKGARLVWFTGAESFNVALNELSSDDAELSNVYCAYIAADWTDLVYASALTLPEAKIYQTSHLTTSTSAAVVFGVLFVAVVPICVTVGGVIFCYKRKKA